jgi:serine/threonine protein kinase
VLEELNRGGMGLIYKARQQGLNRLVALKVIATEQMGVAEALKRFQREVQAAALLSHPNIVTVYHTDLTGPAPFLAMEYVPGIDLFRLVRQVGPLPVADACAYVKQAALGLQHAFENGLVHRDIKPANLMVTPSPLDPTPSGAVRRSPLVKILDMGLARLSTQPTEGNSGLTQAGEFLGTPDFVSPEQAEDPRLADTRSDLYSLGCTLFYLLAGEVPFPGKSLMQKLKSQLTQAPPSVAAKRPEVPTSLANLVTRLMARDPADRFQTPAELADALDAILRELQARPAPHPPSGPKAAAPPQPAPHPPSGPKAAAPPSTPWPAPAIPGGPRSNHPPLAVVNAHPGGVKSISLSSDGHFLLTGGLDETLRLYDATRLRELLAIRGDVGPVNCVALAPGSKWAASCALRLFEDDQVVQLWFLASGAQRRRLKGHTGNVRCLAIAPDGRRVAAGGDDFTIHLWTLDQPGSPSLCLRGHTDRVTCVVFIREGAGLLSAGREGVVRLWDARTGTVKGMLHPPMGAVQTVAFGGPSKRLAMAGNGLSLRQASGAVSPLFGHEGEVLCVAFSVDGALLASGGADRTIRLWRCEDGEELTCWTGHTDKVQSLAFSPDGRTVYSGGADGKLRRWFVPT